MIVITTNSNQKTIVYILVNKYVTKDIMQIIIQTMNVKVVIN
jgi:hypothetical protein